jgi:hypothetical protein
MFPLNRTLLVSPNEVKLTLKGTAVLISTSPSTLSREAIDRLTNYFS